ncbi:BLUF domain-containing protein [Sphingomonas sp. PL-96]|uniref:BLUF domain-containing protein n=1 Tax=Sphingomonas sp. PL-96 TaxID=2887201 RepID=UPI001E418B38|nr:BLUF domain-containing protein [Sphingomonas sp. PL-96]MCC2976625.1 BLUF domain-containing protein [Sphingomonas sp. PL-96]
MPDPHHQPTRRLIYSSTAVGDDRDVDLSDILQSSRVNNALDGITGLLWSDGREYVQVVEGAGLAVAETFERIRSDPRHRDVAVLSDQADVERAFIYWTMAQLVPGEDSLEIRHHLNHLLRDAPPEVRSAFSNRQIVAR